MYSPKPKFSPPLSWFIKRSQKERALKEWRRIDLVEQEKAVGHEAARVVEAVGSAVGDVRVGDHVVLSFVPSCGLCAQCAGGEPILCGAAAAANGEGRMLGGGHRFSSKGAALHHHLGVSAFSERIVVARSSAIVVDLDFSLL